MVEGTLIFTMFLQSLKVRASSAGGRLSALLHVTQPFPCLCLRTSLVLRFHWNLENWKELEVGLVHALQKG